MCAPDSLVCSRLGDVVDAELALAGAAAEHGPGDGSEAPRRQVEAAVCARMGFEVAEPAAGDDEGGDEGGGERAEATCFRGSGAAPVPEGALLLDNSICKPRERVIVEARGLEGGGAETAGTAGVGNLVRSLALATSGPLARAAIAASALVAVLAVALVAWLLCAQKAEEAGAGGHVLGAGPLQDEFASELGAGGVGGGGAGALGALSDEARRQLMLEARRRRFEPAPVAPAVDPAPAALPSESELLSPTPS